MAHFSQIGSKISRRRLLCIYFKKDLIWGCAAFRAVVSRNLGCDALFGSVRSLNPLRILEEGVLLQNLIRFPAFFSDLGISFPFFCFFFFDSQRERDGSHTTSGPRPRKAAFGGNFGGFSNMENSAK